MSSNQVTEHYTHVKVFSATKANDRDKLGETVNEWLYRQRAEYGANFEVAATVVTQSSDSEFHCICITLFYRQGSPRK